MRRYHVSRASVYRWSKQYDGTPESFCYVGTDGEKFYQYTMIDEASRERFIYPYKEQSGFSTVDFVKRAITYFGYAPKQIQIDNGAEFTNFARTERVHIFDKFCAENGIEHKLIRPRTPWHNGKWNTAIAAIGIVFTIICAFIPMTICLFR